jgi:hypothetical protein
MHGAKWRQQSEYSAQECSHVLSESRVGRRMFPGTIHHSSPIIIVVVAVVVVHHLRYHNIQCLSLPPLQEGTLHCTIIIVLTLSPRACSSSTPCTAGK